MLNHNHLYIDRDYNHKILYPNDISIITIEIVVEIMIKHEIAR